MFCNTPDYTYLNSGGVPLKKETHGGDDVGIWAKGRQMTFANIQGIH